MAAASAAGPTRQGLRPCHGDAAVGAELEPFKLPAGIRQERRSSQALGDCRIQLIAGDLDRFTLGQILLQLFHQAFAARSLQVGGKLQSQELLQGLFA